MKKFSFHFKKNHSDNFNKKEPFIPYQNKVKVAYFSYSGLFWFLGILVCIFSLFVMINLAKNGRYHLSSNLSDINFFFTPIFNLILIVSSWILLLLAPKKAYKSPKHSSIMFYCSFWFLVIAVTLNAQLQLTYIDLYKNSAFYNWMNVIFAKIVVILSVFSLLGIQVFFWVMRRKFAFMATDYEIYEQRAENKKEKKEQKILAKQMKKQNAKLANKKV